MSFDDGFILGLSLGGGGGGSSYVNNDPDYALYKSLPEPAANQAVILIRIANVVQHNYISVHYDPEIPDEDITENEGTVDWGDGQTSNIGNNPSVYTYHSYSEPGDYIITVTDNSGGKIESVCSRKKTNYAYPIAMKVGASLVYDDGLGSKYINSTSDFKYIQFASGYIWENGFVFNGSQKLTRLDFLGNTKPYELINNLFRSCNALDFDNLMPMFADVIAVGNYSIYQCYNLKKLDLPNCASVGNYSVYQCYALKEVNLPLCTSVGQNSLSYNYALNKAILPDSCNYGSGAFKYSYCLIPTPNGIYPY